MTQEVFRTSPFSVAESLAKGMLQIKAVDIRPDAPFTWSSGWKSPIYCDNRLILSYPVLRSLVKKGLQSIVEAHYPGVEVIVGAATGGIAHAALLADALGLPTAYVRGSAKGHGKQKRVEGNVVPGAKAIVIEDTLSTGKSAISVAEALSEESDADVLAICSIFSYDFDVAKQAVQETGVPAFRLLHYAQLMEVAVQSGYVDGSQLDALMAWRDKPDSYYA